MVGFLPDDDFTLFCLKKLPLSIAQSWGADWHLAKIHLFSSLTSPPSFGTMNYRGPKPF
jgi:hypothetical protein